MTHMLIVALVLAYDAALIAGTAFLVQVYDWSMWTFLLTAIFFMSTKTKDD